MKPNTLQRRRRLSHHSSRSGFTLLEIIIAIGLVALLVAFAVPNLGNIFGGGQISTTQTWVKTTAKIPLTKFRVDTGNFPTTEAGLKALMNQPAGTEGRWQGPYMEELPKDPWGNDYEYRFPAQKSNAGYDLWSKGPDGVSGTSDDIGNWASTEA